MKNEYEDFYSILSTKNESEIIYKLERFGRAFDNFPYGVFFQFLEHTNPNIRLLSVKNLGKFSNPGIIEKLITMFESEDNTLVRREIVSSIGRKRSKENIPILLRCLEDHDPKVILQAIRGLLYFKDNATVKKRLTKLKNHSNETISYLLQKELTNKKFTKLKTRSIEKNRFENLVVLGDARDVLKKIPTGVVDLTFTSPPYYNARDYSIYKSYEEYLTFLEDTFREVHRVTAEGRFFILNTSPVILPRVSRQHSSKRYAIPFDIHPRIIKLGFDFIDDIIWAKPGASARNRNGGFFQHRKPLGYKPNVVVEYVMVYRKKTDKLIDWNMDQYSKEIVEKSKITKSYEMTNLWHISPSTNRSHPATFPKKLVENVINYYSYVDDLILDPFAGSGTVGEVCNYTDRHYLLIDNNEEYFLTMKNRLSTLPNIGNFIMANELTSTKGSS